ncbi:hypothetical protein [Ottowia sp.]|jgi:hypothetical protein|uniref:hypothetical protein n=1 Tax=Ottowia sp. TaxID=1898956 RepID=UPI0034531752|nr:hypothetical protein [Ottowia sp.]MBK6747216.1 hypothetical protein [Ottowia sp.]
MSKDKDPGAGGGGLLSKVVRFVKSPTTHWSDLDRPDGDAGDSESRLALKEMIERKRRNDFVRNREFDMLRKIRRRGTLRDEDAAGLPSSQAANTGERVRTLRKIDEIEVQMSGNWCRRHGGAPGKGAAPAIQAGSSPGFDKTSPLPLREAEPGPPGFHGARDARPL